MNITRRANIVPTGRRRKDLPQSISSHGRDAVRSTSISSITAHQFLSSLMAAAFGLSSCAATSSAAAGIGSSSAGLAAKIVVEGTIGDIQDGIVSGRLSCRDVVAAYLTRIATYDQPRKLNAISAIAPTAIAQAQTADRNLALHRAMPPLFCVPFVVKDNIGTSDLPTTGGSIALAKSRPPDSEVIRRLRAAGAIIIAKTNMAEWAFSPRRTISSTVGETANAYALDHVPAGSSGGTASAVAASLALVGLGTDTGNSIRGPSSHLALVGMRSTLGLVSLKGVIPLLADYDTVGPMTRTVEDNARVLTVIAGASRGVQVNYMAALHEATLRGVRIGVLRALAEPKSMSPDIDRTFQQAISDLRGQGAVVIDNVTVTDFARHINDDLYCPRFRNDVNAYLMTLGKEAPVHDVAEVFRQGRYAPESKNQFEFFLRDSETLRAAACPSFEGTPGRIEFRSDVVAAMDAADIAALIYPTWTSPPALRSRAVEDYNGDNSQIVAPPTGLPALTVPMGYSGGGLPAGLQVLGRPFDEAAIYRIAYGYERGTHHRIPPPGFPALVASQK